MLNFASLAAAIPLLALAIPATLFCVALGAPRRATTASVASFALAFAVAGAAALSGDRSLERAFAVGLHIDAVTCVMLLLVTMLGSIVARYSQTYLHGDSGLVRYQRWLLLTLSPVTALVMANNLLVVALMWMATSLTLHQLLTYYAERPAALLAAHKKFLVSRVADVCLFSSIALVHGSVGSLALTDIGAWATAHPDLPLSMECAAVLLVLAVALKSAQLPFHGWLMQVMEAPTPVSALLHAGVVNIGGVVLIKLAPWMAQAGSARILLVVIGVLTAAVAALVLTTRISVKVALAWSTCAQMGFMLVQCGLGLWPLAFLHIVAHSLFKAHAFLNAGSAVEEWRVGTLITPQAPRAWVRFAGVAVVAAAVAAILSAAPRDSASHGPELPSVMLAALVGLAVIPLVATAPAGLLGAVQAAQRIGFVVFLTVGWHAAASAVMPARSAASSNVGWVLAGVGFSVLFALKTALQLKPESRLASALYPWLFAGLYLDERFTRFACRVWPPRPWQPPHLPRAVEIPTRLEVRT